MEEGKVIGLDGNKAVVALQRSKDCEGCKACCTLSKDESVMLASVPNTLGVKEGDRVKLEISSSQLLLASLVVYLIPVLFLVGGYFLGAFLFSPLLLTAEQGTGILTAFLMLIVSFLAVKAIENKQKGFFSPKMVKKL